MLLSFCFLLSFSSNTTQSNLTGDQETFFPPLYLKKCFFKIKSKTPATWTKVDSWPSYFFNLFIFNPVPVNKPKITISKSQTRHRDEQEKKKSFLKWIVHFLNIFKTIMKFKILADIYRFKMFQIIVRSFTGRYSANLLRLYTLWLKG